MPLPGVERPCAVSSIVRNPVAVVTLPASVNAPGRSTFWLKWYATENFIIEVCRTATGPTGSGLVSLSMEEDARGNRILMVYVYH